MREIKFRAWDTKRNKYWSPEEMGRDQLTLMPDGKGFINVHGRSTKLSTFVHNLIPEQFTGRKDNNDKETYGGDIVRFPNHPYLAEVKYCPEFAAFLFDSHNDETRNNPYAQMLWSDAFEIIGNIHENPELLEAK